MTGVRKAALLLVQLGRERSGKVLAQLEDAEIEELSAEIMRLGAIEPTESDEVLAEFHQMAQVQKHTGAGGVDFAREMLNASLGADRAKDVLSRVSAGVLGVPFSFLYRADPRQLLSFLADEHPQIIALVLAHLPAAKASQILGGLNADLQAD